MTLTEFLTARLDEDEINAGLARAQWPDTHFTFDPGSLVIVEYHRRHDPARVLREVEAKRKILAEHGNSPNWKVGDPVVDCQYERWPCPTLRALAAVYSDHPDYRQEWAHGDG